MRRSLRSRLCIALIALVAAVDVPDRRARAFDDAADDGLRERRHPHRRQWRPPEERVA